MVPLLTGLLLIASASVAEYIPYRGDIPYASSTDASFPIDYNDDFRVRPKSNLYFSFEQIKRDQTSQVDVREEDIGRYMYRPKVTTTPAPLSEKRNPVIIPDVYMPPIRTNHHWVEPAPTPMAPPPPAPSPKWEGFDVDFRYSPYSQHKPETRVPSPVYEYVFMPQQQPETTVAPVTQPEASQDPARFYIQPTTEQPEYSVVTEGTTTSTTTTIQPHWTEIAAATESHVQRLAPVQSRVGPRRYTGRGSHRFNWHEPVGPAERTHPAVRPAVAAAARAPLLAPAPTRPAAKSPPRPVPTLTPWVGDNF